MQILNKVNAIAPEVTWKEFATKFVVMFFVCMPVPTVGLALAGYFGASAMGFSRGFIPAIMTIGGATCGVVLGFFFTMLLIRAGHKD